MTKWETVAAALAGSIPILIAEHQLARSRPEIFLALLHQHIVTPHMAIGPMGLFLALIGGVGLGAGLKVMVRIIRALAERLRQRRSPSPRSTRSFRRLAAPRVRAVGPNRNLDARLPNSPLTCITQDVADLLFAQPNANDRAYRYDPHESGVTPGRLRAECDAITFATGNAIVIMWDDNGPPSLLFSRNITTEQLADWMKHRVIVAIFGSQNTIDLFNAMHTERGRQLEALMDYEGHFSSTTRVSEIIRDTVTLPERLAAPTS